MQIKLLNSIKIVERGERETDRQRHRERDLERIMTEIKKISVIKFILMWMFMFYGGSRRHMFMFYGLNLFSFTNHTWQSQRVF